MAELYEIPYASEQEKTTPNPSDSTVMSGYVKVSTVLIMFVLMVLVAVILSVGTGVLVYFITSKDVAPECNNNIILPKDNSQATTSDENISNTTPTSLQKISNPTPACRQNVTDCVSCNITQRCPDGWQTFQKSCYYFGRTEVTYSVARLYCHKYGAELVHVNSELENVFLKDQMTQLKGNTYWNGLTDEKIKGVWRWSGNDENVTFFDWGPKEPNNQDDQEDCVVFWDLYSLKWNDHRCDGSFLPVCEWQIL